MSKRLTVEEVILRFKDTHGDVYDYSKVIYVKSSQRVRITCNEHGEFLQRPADHLNGQGCPKCSKRKVATKLKISLDDFIKRSNIKHNNKYNYSLTDYKNSQTKVMIICDDHGMFSQLAGAHMKGQGCPKCADIATGERCRYTLDEFILQAKECHGDTYDYSKTEYKHGHHKLTITCRLHGDFTQKPHHHCSGIGCPECGKDATSKKLCMGTNEFISRSKELHKNLYSYDKSDYKNYYTKLVVTCPLHGDWKITPANHLVGSGCPSCGFKKTGFNDSKTGNLYVLTVDNITKIGITNRTVDKRLREIVNSSGLNFKILKTYGNLVGSECREIETRVLKLLMMNYQHVSGNFDGSTECYVNVDNQWLVEIIDNLVKEEYGKTS